VIVHLFARMARSQSPQAISQMDALAGDSYTARLVSDFRDVRNTAFLA